MREFTHEKLRRLLLQVGYTEKKVEAVLSGTRDLTLARDDIVRLLDAAGTPLMPPVLSDPMSPLTGDAGEHQRVYAYIPGCFDVGHIELKGFTLISNNDLAALKKLALGPEPDPASKDV